MEDGRPHVNWLKYENFQKRPIEAASDSCG